MRALVVVVVLAGCGGTIEASRPRVAIGCPDCKTTGAEEQLYTVDVPVVVNTSWIGTCESTRIGVEGRGGDDTELCHGQPYQVEVTCGGVRCDIERTGDAFEFVVIPREPGTLDVAVRFMPQPDGPHRTLHETLAVRR